MNQELLTHFAVCLNNQGYEAALEVGKLYRVINDEQAQANGLLRVVDESGEDYTFSSERFYPVALQLKSAQSLGKGEGQGWGLSRLKSSIMNSIPIIAGRIF